MNTTHTAQVETGTSASWLRQSYAWLSSTIATFFADEPSSSANTHAADANTRNWQMFAQALKEDSNVELDWLWYAANMTDLAERRYCIERALAINPNSDLAKQALAKLPPAKAPLDLFALLARAADRAM